MWTWFYLDSHRDQILKLSSPGYAAEIRLEQVYLHEAVDDWWSLYQQLFLRNNFLFVTERFLAEPCRFSITLIHCCFHLYSELCKCLWAKRIRNSIAHQFCKTDYLNQSNYSQCSFYNSITDVCGIKTVMSSALTLVRCNEKFKKSFPLLHILRCKVKRREIWRSHINWSTRIWLTY